DSVAASTDGDRWGPRPRPGAAQGSRWLLQQEPADGEGVQRRGPEAFDGIPGAADDGLAAGIERGVDEHRYAGTPLERRQQVVVVRVLVAPDGLHAGGSVRVPDGGDAGSLVLEDVEDEQHEGSHDGAR